MTEPPAPVPPPTQPGEIEDRSAPNVNNIVTDVAAGPNIRKKDNLYQALFILACLAIAVPALWIWSGNWIIALIFGGLIGLVVGVLLSGGFLMVYRLFKH